jgi:hypothetical protein
MNPRTKTQFKTWQRLSELAATGARPVSGRSGCVTVSSVETTGDFQRNNALRTGTVRAPLKVDGARSQALKFIVSTHD